MNKLSLGKGVKFLYDLDYLNSLQLYENNNILLVF